VALGPIPGRSLRTPFSGPVPRSPYEASGAGVVRGGYHSVGNFADNFLQQQAEMASPPIVRGRNMPDPVRVSRKAVAFFETSPAGVIRVVDSNRVPPIFPHDREAGDISWTISDIDHIRKRNRPGFVGHVIVDILGHIQQPLVDSEQVLGFLGVADDTFREADFALGVLRVLAPENGSQIRPKTAALNEDFQTGRNHKMIHVDTSCRMMLLEEIKIEFFEHLRQALVKAHLGTELLELLISGPIQSQVVKKALHVGKLVVISLRLD